MTNQDNRWNQGMPLGQQYKYVPPPAAPAASTASPILTASRQNPPVLPPPATLEAGSQQFAPFASLPALGNRASASLGHMFTIPLINSNDDRRPSVGNRLPHVQYGPLNHSPNSIYNITHQNDHAQMPYPHQQPQPQQPPALQEQPPQAQPAPQKPPLQLQQSQLPEEAAAQPQVKAPRPAEPDAKPAADGDATRSAQAVPQGVINRSSTSNAYRPLNVKDALSYLDQVKIQFYNQADVYNNFLDIMKDFKSQSIDTPGVIDRVSSLFRGHPNLIQGFNTFLPPGYRIECSLDPSDPNPIRVTTPTGTTTRPNISGAAAPYTPAPHWPEQGHPQQMAQFAQDGQPQGPGGQIEFNHAISYVNKIKTRFANQPDIYKQFLEILQTYQREQKPIGEVYEQVTQLFANSPDLLNDFKQFLPDSGNHDPFPQQRPDMPVHGGPAQHIQTDKQGFYPGNGASQLPPLGNFQPSMGGTVVNAEQHYRNFPIAPTQEAIQAANMMMPNEPRKGSEHFAYENNYNDEALFSSIRGAPQPVSGKQKSLTPGTVGVPAIKAHPTLVTGVPEPVPPSANVKTSSLLEELGFFDKVKKAIGNKQTYNEFLKILNLYSQDIIDKDTLVEKVDSFLGDNHYDLLNWFKQFVGFKEETQHIEDITFKKHQIELSLCKAYGPSYRQLPKVETYMPCSGRDEMCWEVLNDEWVGHPTWASEDSGFISHRKNQYEEILFKIEEERLEFDYHMEANLRTIQTLETIANRIANMTPEQKASFKLPPGLGHASQTIYKKVIRKIYDKDRGFEVIDALHENPAVAVPVILKRLKQKDEEWKRAQREWNKVWREMEQKVFYKSLDHLGLTFKQADKKLLTAKQLVGEISTVKVEQQNKRLHPLTPKPQEQLNYTFTDNEVIFDILRLAEFYIFHSSNYSANDREKLGAFFKHFVGLFFGIPDDVIESALARRAEENSSDEPNGKAKEEANSTDASSVTEPSVSKKRNRDPDLLRDVLKKQSKSRKEEADDSPASETEEPDLADEVEKSGELWIRTTSTKFSLGDVRKEEKRDRFNFFCNTTIYVFFRHLRTLYERLYEVKAMNEEVSEEIRSRKVPQFAKDLNLISHQLEDLGVEIIGTKDCYKQVLALTEKLLDGEVEHQWFEESLRQGYRNQAYKCYTIDKVIQSLVKHMHTMVTDSKTSEMVVLFEQDRNNPTSTAKGQILYRMQVRALMSNDENMFKIAYNEPDNSVNIQFVSLDDLTINDHADAEERYNYYVTSYVISHPTEGVPASKINMPFLKNFIEAVDEDQCDGKVSSGLKVSICENSYRLFFESNDHDEFTANSVYSKQKEATRTIEEKLDNLKKVVNDEEVSWKAGLNEETAEKLTDKFYTLLEKGAKEYKSSIGDGDGDVDMNDASEKEEEQAEPQSPVLKPNPDATIDAEATVVNEHNDTTIQQDANDTTMEEATINQGKSITEDSQSANSQTAELNAQPKDEE